MERRDVAAAHLRPNRFWNEQALTIAIAASMSAWSW